MQGRSDRNDQAVVRDIRLLVERVVADPRAVNGEVVPGQWGVAGRLGQYTGAV